MFVMKSASIVHALITAAFLALAGMSSANEPTTDPDSSYLRAGALFEAGIKAVHAGRVETAIGNLQLARSLMQKISQSQPGWQPALVAYKLQKIENTLKDLAASQALQLVVDDDQPEVTAR